MLKSFDPSSDPEYTKSMFRHHCESLKQGVGISQYNPDTKKCYRVTTYQELSESLFPDLEKKVKEEIKKEVGL